MKISPSVFIYSCKLLFILVISTVVGCSKKNVVVPPSTSKTDTTTLAAPIVTVDSVSSLASTSAIIYGSAKSGSGLSDRGIYWGTSAHPTTNKTSATSYSSGFADFSVNITGLQPGVTYWVRSYGVNSKGVSYSNDRQFTTPVPPNHISVRTDTLFASGASTVFAAGYVKDSVGAGIKESGICIGKSASPKITDRKVITPGGDDLNIFVRIDSLKEATNYYIRAYYTDKLGRTSYGNNVAISTITRGKVTYTFVNQDPNADAGTKAAYQRITKAMDAAVNYQNEFTSCVKPMQVNYSPGTPTADGNNSGWINVGSNSAYQGTGTLLHEMQHVLGGGTSWFWPQLIVNGVCVGKYTNQMLQFMTHDPSAKLYGDGMHSWPYGFNGSWEDTGKDMDYIIHCLIVQGMKKDGLPDWW